MWKEYSLLYFYNRGILLEIITKRMSTIRRISNKACKSHIDGEYHAVMKYYVWEYLELESDHYI